jgi:hypothetical protein
MPLFGTKTVSCPVCREKVEEGAAVARHNLQHAMPAEDGGSGFMWKCPCGEMDGVWNDFMGAAAGLTLHMQHKHRIRTY